jgi:hypothetical protein
VSYLKIALPVFQGDGPNYGKIAVISLTR